MQRKYRIINSQFINKFILFIFLITYIYKTNYILAQNSSIGSYINDLFRISVLIELKNGSKSSGFFLSDSNNLYLVTAKHAIIKTKKIDEKQNNYLNDTIAYLVFYCKDIEISDPDTFEINLEKLYYNKLIKFKNDILLINIAKIKNGLLQYNKYINKSKNNKKQLMVNMISITNLIKYNEVLIGNDIYLFGYPTSIGLTMNGAIQFDKNRPLLRKGIIAGKYNDNKTIIIDCPSYYGNSGGPVICFFYSNKKYIIPNIIGINIQFIPYVETWKNIRNNLTREEWSNSGYSVVESSDKIIEILEDFKKNGK